MNRTIKFRGKSTSGKWYFGYYHKDKDGSYIMTETDVYNVYPYSVGQFTGVNDKNGVKIYEGDILKSFVDVGNEEDEIFIGKVYWPESVCGFMFGYEDEDDVTLGMAHCLSEKVEIIGNIHDNPELLKTE